MATSMKTIAKMCNVSEATVSKALSDRPGVSPQTRERIQKVAKKLNYASNALVRGMQRGKTMSVGIGCNGLSNAFAAGLLGAILRELHENHYQALAFDWDQELGEGERAIQSLAERRVDGLILFPPAHLPPNRYIETLRGLDRPVVLVDQYFDEMPFSFVGSDDADGMRQVVAHLCEERGLNKIACLHNPSVSTGRERRTSLVEEMVRRGCRFPKPWDIAISEDPVETYAACRDLLSDPDNRPQALVCFNDEVAAIALSAAQGLGLQVPRDVAVVGYGDLLVSRLVRPGITTVRQPLDTIAVEAVRVLVDLMQRDAEGRDAEASAVHRRVPVELVRRSSTQPIRVEH